MLRFFRSPQPAALFLIPFIAIVLWWPAFTTEVIIPEQDAMPFWKILADLLSSFPSWLYGILMVLLISAQAVYLNLLMNKHEVLYKNSWLPSLFYVLLASAATGFMPQHPLHWVNLLLLFILDKSFSWLKQDVPRASIFDCGFLAAIATLLYFPAFYLLLLLIIALLILRPFSLREWLILLIGFMLPYFFTGIYFFWNHRLGEFIQNLAGRFPMYIPFSEFKADLALKILGGLTSFLLLFALLRLRANYYKNTIRTRSYQQILFFCFLLGAISVFWVKEFYISFLQVLIIPSAVFIAYLFVSWKKRKWLADFFIWSLLILILWNHYFPMHS